MTGDDRTTRELILEIPGVLEHHGDRQHHNQHTGHAAGVIGELARVHDGTRDIPHVTYPGHAQPGPVPAADPDAVILSHADVGTVVAALDIAAACKRDRAETCAGCPGQSCPACQTRLQHPLAYDQIAGRLLQAAEAARAASARQPEPGAPNVRPGQVHPGAGMEAGQCPPPAAHRPNLAPAASPPRPSSPARGRAKRTCPERPNPTTRRSPTAGRQAARNT